MPRPGPGVTGAGARSNGPIGVAGGVATSTGGGEYIKLLFQSNLTRNRDITIYAKASSGNSSVDILRQNGSIITTINNITK